MTTFGICRCKDEADVIAGTVQHIADEVDFVLVQDNNSGDGTREILAELEESLPLKVLDDSEVGYFQSRKMTELADTAFGMGATWIVPFDADELWMAPQRIRDVLADYPPKIRLATARVYDHRASAVDPEGVDPFRTMVWRTPDPLPLPKVAVRWTPGTVIHQGNHGADIPDPHRAAESVLEVRHFPYRSAEQFVKKARNGAAAYAATDLPEHVGAHWRSYGTLLTRYGPEALEDVYRQWFWNLAPSEAGLILDPAPYLRWRPS